MKNLVDLFIFVLCEKWKNSDLWQTHIEDDHLAVYMAATYGHVDEFILNEMSNIEK